MTSAPMFSDVPTHYEMLLEVSSQTVVVSEWLPHSISITTLELKRIKITERYSYGVGEGNEDGEGNDGGDNGMF